MERLDYLGNTLLRRAEEQARARTEIEERWIEDLRQYHGKYTHAVETRLEQDQTGASRIFVNITRPKCMALIARLTEMLFPSDDRNWALQPTPNPEMAQARFAPPDIQQAHQQQQYQAKAAAEGMQREIDDQLTEALYQDRAKEAIRDAVILGTGILKGPIVRASTKKAWTPTASGYLLTPTENYRPGVEVVSPWDFFPDMSAATLDQAEFVFERRYLSKKSLRRLAKNPNYKADAIRAALREPPTPYRRTDSRWPERRAVVGQAQGLSADETQYEWWEYRGPLDPEDLAALGLSAADDPLLAVDAIIEFIGIHIIRARLNELDSDDPVYSVFTLVEDESSLFGYGIPSITRSSQSVLNAAWRMMLDNSAYSTGPQLIIHRELVTPANGVYALQPRKLWFMEDKNRSVNEVFGAFKVDSYQPELMAIYQTAKQLIEEESQIPALVHGEMGANPAQTATGMSMLMNSANTVLREVVKRWDDRVTKTLIRRFYDWNMQYSDRNEIKGDFEIDARGSSALMVKETQSQALVQLTQIVQQPGFMPLVKFPSLLRKLVETLRLSTDELVKTDDELQAQAQQQQQASAPETQAAQAQQEQQAQLAAQQQQLDYQMHAETLAAEERLKAAELADKQQQREVDVYTEQLKQQQFQQESALKAATGSGL